MSVDNKTIKVKCTECNKVFSVKSIESKWKTRCVTCYVKSIEKSTTKPKLMFREMEEGDMI